MLNLPFIQHLHHIELILDGNSSELTQNRQLRYYGCFIGVNKR